MLEVNYPITRADIFSWAYQLTIENKTYSAPPMLIIIIENHIRTVSDKNAHRQTIFK